MQTKFKTIGILGKPSDPDIADTLTVLYHFLSKKHTVLIDSHSAHFITEAKSSDIEDFGQYCNLVIAVGGDGTFLAAARAIAGFDIPLIGINLGRLGFLVDISPNDMVEKLTAILSGEYDQEQRYLLHARIIRKNKVFHEEMAVNEVVVHRWVTPSMIEITTKINGVFLNTQRSDGLIISTPTGSTAYALSAGGPILHPALHALVLVPLNPHTFSNRPIVIEDNAEIEITFSQTSEINALVTCDHLEIPEVVITDKIVIKKVPKPITILHPKGHDFFNTLRNKLNWSSGYNT